eukprot:3460619-Prymnesium_polylepis.1
MSEHERVAHAVRGGRGTPSARDARARGTGSACARSSAVAGVARRVRLSDAKGGIGANAE